MCAAAAVKSFQSFLTLCDPIDSSPPGSAIPGILQARTLEWVAIWALQITSGNVPADASRNKLASSSDPLTMAFRGPAGLDSLKSPWAPPSDHTDSPPTGPQPPPAHLDPARLPHQRSIRYCSSGLCLRSLPKIETW